MADRSTSGVWLLRFIAFVVFVPVVAFSQTGSFQQVPGSLSQISVGADGAVWGIDSAQRIFTYDVASNQFVQVPGSLTQIAVGNVNAVWGINAQEQIFQWNASIQS